MAAYTAITADLAKDRDAIRSLWDRNYDSVAQERFFWIYESNPGGEPVCFLLRHESSSSIVGAVSLFPRDMSMAGKKIIAYICGDFLVDHKHRSLGPALILLKAAIARIDEQKESILFGFPNKVSEPVTLRAGFKILGNNLEMTKVIRSYSYLKKYVHVSSLAKLLSFPVDLFLRIKSSRRCKGSTHRYRYRLIKEFNKLIDDFGRQLDGVFSLKGVVCSSYLNWRFTQSPYAEHTIFLVTTDAQSVAGYIVFESTDTRVTISDIAFKDHDAFHAMISMFDNHVRACGTYSISIKICGSASIVENLSHRGFEIRADSSRVIVYAAQSLKKQIENISHGEWYLTTADNDI